MSTETPNYLELDDEAFLALPDSQLQAPVSEAPAEPADAPAAAIEPVAPVATENAAGIDDDDEDADTVLDARAPATAAEEAAATAEGDTVATSAEDAEGQPDEAAGAAEASAEGVAPEAADPAQPEAAATIDYQAEYERLLKPFKANGRELSVQSVDEAIQLMQMGANYNKKMAALKPHLRMLKTLEKHELLSEDKLNFLIDLEKKNPEAIKKLLKDSGVDPLDMNLDDAAGYRPNTYTAHPQEVELDQVLDEIQDRPSYREVLDVVSNKWDARSKQLIAEHPPLLKVLSDHVENGVYPLISKEIERERMFGRLNGLSDLEAYRQVGDALAACGAFDHLASAQAATKSAPAKTVVSKPRSEDPGLNAKRRAASPTKAAAPAAPAPADVVNPLSLPDEEFERLVNQRLL